MLVGRARPLSLAPRGRFRSRAAKPSRSTCSGCEAAVREGQVVRLAGRHARRQGQRASRATSRSVAPSTVQAR